MLQPLKTQATYADLCAVPELLIAELIDGDLYASARPPIPYVCAASALEMRIGAAFDHLPNGPGAWFLLDKPEIHLRDDAIVPDIAAWRRERVPKNVPDYFNFAPDWLCEILAPNTEALDARRSSSCTRVKGFATLGWSTPRYKRSRCCVLNRSGGR